jgi:hypothetical protein
LVGGAGHKSPSELAQQLELLFEPFDEDVQIGQRLPVGVEAPVETAVVAEQGDAERLIAEEGNQRVRLEQPRAIQIAGEGGSRRVC